MERVDIGLLGQLVNSLEEARVELEKSYNKKNPERFEKAKKFILQIQRKISEEIK